MGLLGIKVPEQISRLLRRIKVPGEPDPVDHITIFYFEEQLSTKDIAKMCEFLPDVLKTFPILDIEIERISSFPKNDDGKSAIKADIKCKKLTEMRKDIKDLLKEKDISFSDKWPDFNPHITLSYNDEEIDEIVLKDDISWVCGELVLWPAEWGDVGMNINFPLSEDDDLVAMAGNFYNLVK